MSGGDQEGETVVVPVPSPSSARPQPLHLRDGEGMPPLLLWKGESGRCCCCCCCLHRMKPFMPGCCCLVRGNNQSNSIAVCCLIVDVYCRPDCRIVLSPQIDNGTCICAAMPTKITILRLNESLNKFCIRKVSGL